MEIAKTECVRCKALHPETLYPSDDKICVYCKADEAERVEKPPVKISKKEQQKITQEAAAQRELALRALSRKHMLPFVERFDSN